MAKNHTLTFSEDEIMYLLIIAGADSEDIFERFDLLTKDTTKERLESGRKSLLERKLVSFPEKSEIPVMDDVVIGLIGAVAVGNLEGDYYFEAQTSWRAKMIKEDSWYVIEGGEVDMTEN